VNRRTFLKSAACSLAASPLMGQAAARKPNVIVIVADDLGYGELSIQGGQDIPTPNIDSLAKNGVRFTDGYVTCPVCSPTRAGLNTGRYQQRFGHEFNPGPQNEADSTFGLPLSETTLANRMKTLGYKTGMVGKWHLGYRPELQPQKRGFDEFFGFLGGAHPYTSSQNVLRGTEPANEKEYLTDAFAREAVAFIDRQKSQPFFLYLTFNAVHNPLQAPDKYLERFKNVTDERRRIFSAMLSGLDDGVGRLLAKLRESKLEEDTLIFFVSDNGGPTTATTARNGPLRGYKGQVLEGGVRVPYMMQWKGKLPAGKVYRQPVNTLDIHPTAVAAAGGSIPPDAKLDGVNLIPYLTGSGDRPPHEALYWRFGPQSAIRKGDWKLVNLGEGEPELYNLSRDIGEKQNLAASEPAKKKELEEAYQAWDSQLAKPLWERGGRKRARAGVARPEGERRRKRRRDRD